MNKKLEDFYKPGRFQEIKGYKIDKYIMRIAFLICLIILISAFVWTLINGSFYVYCPEGSVKCFNPFYGNCEERFRSSGLCDYEFINEGDTFGVKPPLWISDIVPLVFIILIIALGINHLIHNNFRGVSK